MPTPLAPPPQKKKKKKKSNVEKKQTGNKKDYKIEKNIFKNFI